MRAEVNLGEHEKTPSLRPSIRVIVVEPECEGNIGSIARAMKNFGLHELWLVNPRFKIGSESKRFAMHAGDVLTKAVTVGNLQDATSGVDVIVGTSSQSTKSMRNILRLAITPSDLGRRLPSNACAALVFGRESSGLSNEELEVCDVLVTIPTDIRYVTMNVSHAATVLFYEIYKAHIGDRGTRFTEADRDSTDRLMRSFKRLLCAIELPSHRRRLASRSFRNVMMRSFISRREASLLLGVLHRILQRL